MKAGASVEVLQTTAAYFSRVSAWRGGVLLAGDVPILSGRAVYSVDSDSKMSGSLSITVPRYDRENDWYPASPYDALAAAGQTLSVVTVVVDPSTGVEYETPVGVFLIMDTTEREPGLLEVEAVDMSQVIADDTIAVPLAPRSTGTLASEFRRLLPEGMSVAIDSTLVDRACPQTLEWSDDRLAALESIARAWPARLRFDAYGQLRLLPALADAIVTPDVTIKNGETKNDGTMATLLKAERKASRDRLYNRVIVRSADTTDPTIPPLVEIVDQTAGPYKVDPNGFRTVARGYSSPLLTKRPQLVSAGRKILADALRPSRIVPVECLPDPRIELDDSALILSNQHPDTLVWEESRRGYVVGIDLPLTQDDGAMRLDVAVG